MQDKTAIYIRVSLEDEDMHKKSKVESGSISNQRTLLTSYATNTLGLCRNDLVEYYDDGFTGRNFERPGFQNMIEQCRKGAIQTIIVKDLSRLGRNYVEVGNLLEQIFPFLGVRIVSVNDGYDSDTFLGTTGGMDVAFKNLIYNLYSKDLSQKVKSAIATRMKKGEYLSPYGIFEYKKSEDDIHKLVIDEDAACIIRRIFLTVIAGTKRQKIAQQLNREGIPTAAAHKAARGCSRSWYPNGTKGGCRRYDCFDDPKAGTNDC